MVSSHLISLNHRINTFHNDQVCFFKGALKKKPNVRLLNFHVK